MPSRSEPSIRRRRTFAPVARSSLPYLQHVLLAQADRVGLGVELHRARALEQFDVVGGVEVIAAQQVVLGAVLVAAEIALGDRGAVVRRVGVAADDRDGTLRALFAQRAGRRRIRRRRPRRSGNRLLAQTPLNSGLRFSMNAESPSWRPRSRTAAPRARARARDPHPAASLSRRSQSSFMAPMASPAPPASFSAYSRVFSGSSAGYSLSRIPRAWASEGRSPAGHHQVERLGHPDHARQALGTPVAGQQAQRCLRQPEHVRALGPEAQVAGQGDLQPAPERVAPIWAMNTLGAGDLREGLVAAA